MWTRSEFAKFIIEHEQRLIKALYEGFKPDAPEAPPAPEPPEPRKLRQSEQPGIDMNSIAREARVRVDRAAGSQRRRYNGLGGITDHAVRRCTVPTPTPNSAATWRKLLPEALAARIAFTLTASSATVGRSTELRAFRPRPSQASHRRAHGSCCARTRRTRPSSGTWPCRDGVVVSMPCWCRYRSTFLACSSCNRPTRSSSERPSRSTDHAATRSNSLRATACISLSRPGRPSRPLAPEMPWSLNTATTCQPWRSATASSSLHLVLDGLMIGRDADVEGNSSEFAWRS